MKVNNDTTKTKKSPLLKILALPAALFLFAMGFGIRFLFPFEENNVPKKALTEIRVVDGEIEGLYGTRWVKLGAVAALKLSDPFIEYTEPAAATDAGLSREGGKVPVYIPPSAPATGGGSSGSTGGGSPAAPTPSTPSAGDGEDISF